VELLFWVLYGNPLLLDNNRLKAIIFLGTWSAFIGGGTGGVIGAILGNNYVYSINKGKISFLEIDKWNSFSRKTHKNAKLEKILFEDDYSLRAVLEGKELWLIKSLLKVDPFSDYKDIQILKKYYEKIVND
jgi:hypothetical protein